MNDDIKIIKYLVILLVFRLYFKYFVMIFKIFVEWYRRFKQNNK